MARKPPKPNAPASTKPAKLKPGSGSEPAGENTQGLITPKTEPNAPGKPSDPPVKAETPQEQGVLAKAGELIKEGEIKALAKLKESMAGAIDTAVESSGYSVPAMVAGAIGKAVVEVFVPDNVIDAIPGGKVANVGRKTVKLGERTAEVAGKDAAKKGAEEVAAKEAKSVAEKEAKAAGGSGGGFSKSTKRRPRHGCELMKYKDMICDGEKHHVMPDFLMRTGSAKRKMDAATRVPGTPDYGDGLAICISKTQHQGLHKAMDEKIQAAGQSGTISAGKAKDISSSEAAKKSGCNPKNIKKQLDRKLKMPDDKQLRAVKDARRVTDDLANLLRGDTRK